MRNIRAKKQVEAVACTAGLLCLAVMLGRVLMYQVLDLDAVCRLVMTLLLAYAMFVLECNSWMKGRMQVVMTIAAAIGVVAGVYHLLFTGMWLDGMLYGAAVVLVAIAAVIMERD